MLVEPVFMSVLDLHDRLCSHMEYGRGSRRERSNLQCGVTVRYMLMNAGGLQGLRKGRSSERRLLKNERGCTYVEKNVV